MEGAFELCDIGCLYYNALVSLNLVDFFFGLKF